MKENLNSNVTDLELDLLLLYFTFSDQYGRVDILAAAEYAAKKLGVIISRNPFTITQTHIDILMDKSVIPDTRAFLSKLTENPTRS